MAVKFKWGRTLNAFDTSVKIVPSEENSKSNAENKTEKKNAVKNTTVNKKENALPGHTISSDKTANINKGKRLARNSKVTASRSNNFKSRAERIGLDINDYYYDVGRYGLDAANKNFEKKLNSGETKYKAEQAKKNNEFLRLKNTEYYAKRDNILRQYQSQILSDRNAADVTAKGRNNPNNRIINNISKILGKGTFSLDALMAYNKYVGIISW